jgi:hypothetical protein
MNKEVAKGRALDDSEALQVVASLIKQGRESIEQFHKGGRQDLVDKEQAELALLEALMPPPMSLAEIDDAVAQAITETAATSMKDMGRVMKAVMAAFAGRSVDGKIVSDTVRQKLAG